VLGPYQLDILKGCRRVFRVRSNSGANLFLFILPISCGWSCVFSDVRGIFSAHVGGGLRDTLWLFAPELEESLRGAYSSASVFVCKASALTCYLFFRNLVYLLSVRFFLILLPVVCNPHFLSKWGAGCVLMFRRHKAIVGKVLAGERCSLLLCPSESSLVRASWRTSSSELHVLCILQCFFNTFCVAISVSACTLLGQTGRLTTQIWARALRLYGESWGARVRGG